MVDVEEPKIRLRYSSVVMYISKSISFATGAMFLMLISRAVGVEIGLWQLLMSYINISLIPSSVVTYWGIRYASRGYYTVNDGLKGISVVLLIGSALYFYTVYISLSFFANKLDLVVIGYLYLVATYLTSFFRVTAFSRAPQASGFSIIVFESIKLGFIVLTYYYRLLSILMVMVILLVSRLTEFSFVFFRYHKFIYFGERFEKSVYKKWLMAGWIPLLSTMAVSLSNIDRLVMGLITSSYEPIAYFSIAFALAGLVSQTVSVASVLYPKLLRGGNKSDIIITFKLSLLFSLPLVPIILVASEQILQFFGIEFVAAASVARVLILAEIFVLIDNILNNIFLGAEDVDTNSEFHARDLVKSWLFKIPVINNIFIGFYVALLASFNYLFRIKDPVELAFYWAIIYVVYRAVLLTVKFILSRKIKKIEFAFPLRSFIVYSIAALLATPILLIMPKFTRELRLLELVAIYSPYLVLFLLVYVGVCIVLDDEARYLFNRLIVVLKK